jgi:hypothetical protein
MTSKLTQLTEQKTAAQLKTLSVDSFNWLKRKIVELRNPSGITRDIVKEKDRYTRTFRIGMLYFFAYDPKTKADLPYYDTFPLVLILEKYPDGFLGLNLHYLPIKYRIAFLSKLMTLAVLDDSDDIKRMRVSYDILNASRRYKEFRPCLKKYLYGHLKSRMLTIKPNEWDVASMLPVHHFKGAKPTQVWQESVEEIRNN